MTSSGSGGGWCLLLTWEVAVDSTVFSTSRRNRYDTDISNLMAQHEAQVAAIHQSYDDKLNTAETARQSIVSSFMEEAESERVRLVQEQALAVEAAVAHAVAERDAHLERTVAQLTQYWEEKLSELSKQKDGEKTAALEEQRKQHEMSSKKTNNSRQAEMDGIIVTLDKLRTQLKTTQVPLSAMTC